MVMTINVKKRNDTTGQDGDGRVKVKSQCFFFLFSFLVSTAHNA